MTLRLRNGGQNISKAQKTQKQQSRNEDVKESKISIDEVKEAEKVLKRRP